jgi:hypothetical protein
MFGSSTATWPKTRLCIPIGPPERISKLVWGRAKLLLNLRVLVFQLGRSLALPILQCPLVIAVLAPTFIGCSQSSTHGTVNGTVELDGEPLHEGTVRFVPIDGASQTASAMVMDGKFTAKVPIGQMRVEFSAPKVVGKQRMYNTPDNPVVDVVEERLPPRYNVQSELLIDVQRGVQDVPFNLTGS